MSAIQCIKEHLATIEPGKPFAAKALYHLASNDNVRQVLARLVKAGELRRVARGILVKPKQVAGIGELLPSVREVTEVITQATGETIAIHGAEAARQLQLTTQVPMQAVYYTNGTSRTLRIGKRRVTLKHIAPSKLRLSGTVAGTVVFALSYLGKTQVTPDTIHLIKRRLSESEFSTVMGAVEHMPRWMADSFYRYRARNQTNSQK